MAIESGVDVNFGAHERDSDRETGRGFLGNLLDSAKQKIEAMKDSERNLNFQSKIEDLVDGAMARVQQMTDRFEKNRYGIIEQIGNSVWKEKLEQINDMIKKAKGKLEKLVKALEKARSENRAENLANDIDHLENVLIPYYEELKGVYQTAISSGSMPKTPDPYAYVPANTAPVINQPTTSLERNDDLELNSIRENRKILRQNGLKEGSRINVMGEDGIEDNWKIHEIAPNFIVVKRLNREGTKKHLTVQEIIDLNVPRSDNSSLFEEDALRMEEDEVKRVLPEVVQKLTNYQLTGDPNRDTHALVLIITSESDESILEMDSAELREYLTEARDSILADDLTEAGELRNLFLRLQEKFSQITDLIIAEISQVSESSGVGATKKIEPAPVNSGRPTSEEIVENSDESIPEDPDHLNQYYQRTFGPLENMKLVDFAKTFDSKLREKYHLWATQRLKNAIKFKAAGAVYPDNVRSVLGGAPILLVKIMVIREKKTLTPDEIAMMPFSEVAKKYLDIDLPSDYFDHFIKPPKEN